MSADKGNSGPRDNSPRDGVSVGNLKAFIKEHLLEFRALEISTHSIRLDHTEWRFHVDQRLTLNLIKDGMSLVSDLPARVQDMDESSVTCVFDFAEDKQQELIKDLVGQAKGGQASAEPDGTVLKQVLTDLKVPASGQEAESSAPDPAKNNPTPPGETGGRECPICLNLRKAGDAKCATCGYEYGRDEPQAAREGESAQKVPTETQLASPVEDTQTVSMDDTLEWGPGDVKPAPATDLEATVFLDSVPQGEHVPQVPSPASAPAPRSSGLPEVPAQAPNGPGDDISDLEMTLEADIEVDIDLTQEPPAPPANAGQKMSLEDTQDPGPQELVFEEKWLKEAMKNPEETLRDPVEEKKPSDSQPRQPGNVVLEEPEIMALEEDAVMVQAAKATSTKAERFAKVKAVADAVMEVPEDESADEEDDTVTIIFDPNAVEEMEKIVPEPPKSPGKTTSPPEEEGIPVVYEDDGDDDAEEHAGEDAGGSGVARVPPKPGFRISREVARDLAQTDSEYAQGPVSTPFQDPRPLEELLGLEPDTKPQEPEKAEVTAQQAAEQAAKTAEVLETAEPEPEPEPESEHEAMSVEEREKYLNKLAATTMEGDGVLARMLMHEGPDLDADGEYTPEGEVGEYFELFRLNKEPFSNSPDPDFYYQAWQHRECLKRIEISLRLKRGMCVVLGDVGTGKTTMSRQLHRTLARDESIITYLFLEPLFKAGIEFLSQLIETIEAETPPPGASEHQMLECIKNRLFELAVEKNMTVALIFDEGQRIPSHCLELLRLLLNYETNHNKLIQIVIFAQKEFEEIVKVQHNFTDRINDLITLQPLNHADTREMIQYRLERAYGGMGAPKLFSPAAIKLIHRLTGGYPRKIVNVCHKTLLALARQDRDQATPTDVRMGAKEATLPPNNKLFKHVAMALGLLLVLGGLLYLLFGPLSMGARIMAVFAGGEGPPVPEEPAPGPEEAAPVVAPSGDPREEPVLEDGAIQVETDPDAESHVADAPEVGDEGAVLLDVGPDETEVIEVLEQDSSAEPEAEATEQQDESEETPSVPAEYPESLGTATMHSGSLSQMIYDVYGQFNQDFLRQVAEANPQINDVNAMSLGDEVVFPPIESPEQPAFPLERTWLGVGDAETLEQGLEHLYLAREAGLDAHLLTYWSAEFGLRHTVVLAESFSLDFNQFTAIEGLGELPQEFRDQATVIEGLPEDTVLFTNKFPLP
ncbi:MAG: hypothetical protein D6E12_06910 [Desulfovibrio sp.]|nr:MAG: hypothetical protein D6E12_06910 [Desulfovibrio sp.]